MNDGKIKMLTIAQAAKLAGVSRGVIERRIQSGKLLAYVIPCTKGQLRIPENAIKHN